MKQVLAKYSNGDLRLKIFFGFGEKHKKLLKY